MHSKTRLALILVLVTACAMLALSVVPAAIHYGSHKDKLWLHRANAVEKAEEFSDLYTNFELDLCLRSVNSDSVVLDVTHDADTSFGQTLIDYADHIKKNRSRVWLDVKNLTEDNANAFDKEMQRMMTLAQTTPDRLIIESDNPSALAAMSVKGYETSLYCRLPRVGEMSESDRDSIRTLIQHLYESRAISEFSFPIEYMDVLNVGNLCTIPKLTWSHRTRQFTFLLSPSNRTLLQDTTIRCILLKARGNHHR